MDLLEWTAGQLAAFALVFARTAGLVVVAPGFGWPVLPVRVRLALAFGLAILLAPGAGGEGPSVAASTGALLVALAGEAALGAALGLGVAALFAGIQLAGLLLDQMTGLGLAGALDPVLAEGEGPLGRFQSLLALVLFLLLDGHYLLLKGLAASFAALPIAAGRWSAGAATFLADTTVGSALESALRVCAPTLGALVLFAAALAIVARAIPELNVFLHGFPVQVLVGLAVFALAIPALSDAVASGARDGARSMETLIRMVR